MHMGDPLPSQIIKSSAFNLYTWLSSARNSVPAGLVSTMICCPAILSASKACNGCPISCNTKLVMSTTLLIDFTPMDCRCRCIQSGDGPIFIPLMTTPEYRGHALVLLTVTLNFESVVDFEISGIAGDTTLYTLSD